MNDELQQRIRDCTSLPSLPTIAIQVLELAKKADIDIAEIARVISKDAAMSGKILKTVNSSFYGRSQHVSTISHALVILGLQSVKTLVLGFSLVTNLTRTKAAGFKHLTYWKRSIFAATAARTIAATANLVQQEEAFLAALLMDIGMLVLDIVFGPKYSEINAKIVYHKDLPNFEQAVLGGTHAEVGGVIAELWKLPPLLALPIALHHSSQTPADPTMKRLVEVVRLGGRCADVFVDEDPSGAIADVRTQLSALCGMSETDCDALLQEIGKKTKEAATLFEINIGSVTDYETILKRANEALVEITLQSQMQATQLQEQNVQLKLAATTDGLTGLSNRAHFDQFLAGAFTAAMKQKTPISLLLMDVDRFKSINDKHGHPAGDQVLRVLGKLLKSAARPQDVAARYGGEEMCLILPGTSRAVAALIAESIRRAIAANPIPIGEMSLPVTASIGVACHEPDGPFRTPAHLIKAADLSVYAAKESGRNCVRVFSFRTPAAA
jgi:two-component system cell cycle response regulator